jgi:DNA adenine methylase
VQTTGSARFDLTKLVPMLEDVHERLAGVVIECLPFEALIARYDRPQTLFYLDPPYWGSEDYYGADVFSAADFERLSALLEGLQGRFILSINDVPAVRDIFAWADIEEVSLNYRLSGPTTAAKELIITGRGR